MKLRDAEAKVLAAVGLRGEVSLSELSRIVKLRPHVCRHALESLFTQSLLRRRVVVNPCRLGLKIFNLWFSIPPSYSARRSKIVAALSASPHVAYLGEFEGEFSHRLDLYVHSAFELDRVIGELTAALGELFTRRALSCTLSISDYALRFLASSLQQPAALVIGEGVETVAIPDTDRAILSVLAASGQESHATIARRLGIAPTSFEYRLKRLREQGIIVGYHVVPEVEGLGGRGLSMHVHRLRLSRTDVETRRRADSFAADDESVWGITHMIGTFDLEICSAGESPQAERDFSLRLDRELGDIIDEHASVSIVKHLKVNSYPFPPPITRE